jgi:hypothetical protein
LVRLRASGPGFMPASASSAFLVGNVTCGPSQADEVAVSCADVD